MRLFVSHIDTYYKYQCQLDVTNYRCLSVTPIHHYLFRYFIVIQRIRNNSAPLVSHFHSPQIRTATKVISIDRLFHSPTKSSQHYMVIQLKKLEVKTRSLWLRSTVTFTAFSGGIALCYWNCALSN